MVLKSKLAAKRAAAAAAGPQIVCSAQQSRFHDATLQSSPEIDLKDVTISIGERDLLAGAHLRLKTGVRYGLVGR